MKSKAYKLADSIINIVPTFMYYSNGPDYGFCPFCSAEFNKSNTEMHEIDHKPECIYWVAKEVLDDVNEC